MGVPFVLIANHGTTDMTICLPLSPSRSVAAVLLACAAATTPAVAQGFPGLAHSLNSAGDEIGFTLSNPTPGAGTYAMLCCYVDVIGADGAAALIRKSVGAVNQYTSASTSPTNPFTVPDVTVSTPLDEVYTVPPSIIHNALAEVEYGTSSTYAEPFSHYLLPFADEVAWNIQSGNDALPWSTFENSLTTYDVWGMVRRTMARQIAYVAGLSQNDGAVLSQVDSIMMTCVGYVIPVGINVVTVELTNGGPGDEPSPPEIKLSRNKRIVILLPASGGNGDPFYRDENFCYWAAPSEMVAVEIAGQPGPGPYAFFVPTVTGYEAVAGTLKSANGLFWLEATMPQGLVAGEFALWDAGVAQYIPMPGLEGVTTVNVLLYASFGLEFNPFPLSPF